MAIANHIASFAPGLLHAVDRFGRTPLHIAAFYGHSQALTTFLLNGGSLTRDRDGRTPIHHAAWSGCKDCLKVLLSFSTSDEKGLERELDLADHEKATALHLAAARNHTDAVVLLLDNKAKITDNVVGQNCLDIAIAREFPECASVIINHSRWEDAMKPLADNPAATSQMQLLVQKMPEQAVMLMDNCIDILKNEEKRTYTFKYMLGQTEQESLARPLSGRLFEVVKYPKVEFDSQYIVT
jgi:ankyrin repeat protein